MELEIDETDNVICYYLHRGKEHKCLGLNIPLHLVMLDEPKADKTLYIIYPKGKRPDLGYPVNNKKEEK